MKFDVIKPAALLLFLSLVAGACGFVADENSIVMAKMDGKNITRGDLRQHIRKKPDDEKPIIQTKADVLRELNAYINDTITADLAAKLHAEGKIDVDREVARAAYLKAHPEFASAFAVQDPTALGMTQADVEAVKASVEFGIDDEVDKMMRDEAIAYRMAQAVEEKAIDLTIEDVRREYELRKPFLVKYEFIEFIGMLFPLEAPGALEEAVRARERIDNGEKFDDVISELMRRNPNLGTRSAIQNDPASDTFRAFWESAHGAKVGQILGPLILPAHQDMGIGQDGKPIARQVPASYVVLEVVAQEPERLKTFEEAGEEVATALLRKFALDQVRAEHGVEVYEDKLYDPSGFGDQYKDSMIKTGPQQPQ